MEKLKRMILEKCSKRFVSYLLLINKYNRESKNIIKTVLFAMKASFQFYIPNLKLPKGKQIQKLFNRVKIKINEKEMFIKQFLVKKE